MINSFALILMLAMANPRYAVSCCEYSKIFLGRTAKSIIFHPA